MGEQKKPAIRFKGFTDDWEQCKFEEVFIEKREKTIKENEDTLLSCAIDGIYLNSELFTHFRGSSTIGYLKVKKNDLILSAQNLHLGNANVNLRFESGIISPAYKTYDLIECNPYFVHAWIKKAETKNFFLAASTEGASICRKNIEWDTLNKQTLCFPNKKEQEEIGQFFYNIDNLITLHQRKYDKLVNIKKSMLEKMFPKDGAKVPEIRFDGFTDDWEQRKLEDMAEFNKGKGYSKGDLCASGTPIILYGRLYTKYETIIKDVDTFVIPQESSVYSKGGEVIVPASGETAEDIARAATVENAGILLGGDLNIVTPNKDVNAAFLALSISNGEQKKELAKKAQGKSVVHIHNEEIKELEIAFPKKVEQANIAAYFAEFDNLITLHQRKLEKLQNIKKSMLEKMFV